MLQENESTKYLAATSVAASEASAREASVVATGEVSVIASGEADRPACKAASGAAKREADKAFSPAASGVVNKTSSAATSGAARREAKEAAGILTNEAVSRSHFTRYYRKPIPEIRIEMEHECSEVRESIL